MTGGPTSTAGARIVVIDDHDRVRQSLRALLESADFQVTDYPSATVFLGAGEHSAGDCILADVRMPGMTGLELHQELVRRGVDIPVIIITGHGDVPLAVRAMRAGVSDFLEKPFDDELLLASIQRAVETRTHSVPPAKDTGDASMRLGQLTQRERQVLDRLILGESNKAIGHHLGISPRTIEIHRARVLEKMQARCIADLVRAVRPPGTP